MKNHLKDTIFESFLGIVEEKLPEMSEAQRRRLCEALVDSSNKAYLANSKGIADQSLEAIRELEKHRAQFKNFVDDLQKGTNKLLFKFKEQGFVTKKYDPNSQKSVLKGRTTMVDDMVFYLNSLNDLVILFYKDVYKMEDTSHDTPQITLF